MNQSAVIRIMAVSKARMKLSRCLKDRQVTNLALRTVGIKDYFASSNTKVLRFSTFPQL